ncbi:MAG: DUF3179 domain-containing protein [Bacteroidetes bacterium]|nr:DUF3179 domain-containing protein [Bacteroidota bacterium]
MVTHNILIIFASILLFSCKNDSLKNDDSPWLIPKEDVQEGGPGKDGIPALKNPDFTTTAGATYLGDNDLVLGYKVGNEIRAYPHPILDWHEIINDDVDGKKIAITYCPLTGSGIGWKRRVGGVTTTFGVSGLLYNSNLIPFDRKSGSNWSQMKQQCVNGEFLGDKPITYHLVETSWKTWKEMYPQTKVISEQTGFNRDYTVYPYGDYRTDNNYTLFTVSREDLRLPGKERILGVIIGEKVKAYSIESFNSNVLVINDAFQSTDLVVIGNKQKNFLVAFESKLQDGTKLTFTAVQDQLPLVMTDNEGNKWDLFGEALEGGRKGERLIETDSFIAFWFAWAAFHEDIVIY